MGEARSDGGRLVAVQLLPGSGVLHQLEEIWSVGDAVLSLDPEASGSRLAGILDETRPALLRTSDGERALPDPRPAGADVALVMTTSGTRGRPKAVELTHAALAASVRAGLERIGAAPGDRWVCCLPLHHVAGILVLLRSRELGTEPIVHPRFAPKAVAAEDGATHVSLVPTMLHRMLDAGADVSRFERILLGGAPPGRELLERAERRGARVTVTYGMTETSGGCVYDGIPLDGIDVELRDHGRIAIRGPVLMRGYRGRPAQTAEVLRDGWLLTNDLGVWDDDGRLRVRGRMDDVIVTGGENVASGEVGAVLREHPAVVEVHVEGRPDPDLGERVVAVCVPRDPASPPALEDLRDLVVERLGRQAAPRELVLVDELPRTAMGEVAGRSVGVPREVDVGAPGWVEHDDGRRGDGEDRTAEADQAGGPGPGTEDT